MTTDRIEFDVIMGRKISARITSPKAAITRVPT